ncbi:MAG: S8 family serine peptidase, partial [Polyangiales bacterium]
MPRNSSFLAGGRISLRTAAILTGMAMAAPPLSAAAPEIHSLTLVTGDRVLVRADKTTTVLPAAGRANIQWQTLHVRDHLHLIPADAVPLLQRGELDPSLFDLTALVEYGYHGRASTPVIVVDKSAPTGARSSSASARGAANASPWVGRALPSVSGVALEARSDGAFWRTFTSTASTSSSAVAPAAAARKVWLDRRLKPNLEQSVPQIGGDVAQQLGFDGRDVKVAVLDSGIDRTHPDLADRVEAHQNFVAEEEDDTDLVGHGTHVASTIAGTGAASDGRFQGVAPGVRLLDAKVCVVNGCSESSIIAGLQWAADQGARVVNISLGGTDTPEIDLVEEAVNTLSEQAGFLVVVSAGNSGDFEPVGSPASADAALAVAAVDKQDIIAPFSSRGPRVGDGALKPEIAAPGVDIVAARSTALGEGEAYWSLSGTSMAAPHVAGVAALLVQAHPEWQGPQLRAALLNASHILEGLAPTSQGAGRVDAPAAIELQLHATPPTVSFPKQAWPHDDDEPVVRTFNLTNDRDHAVTIALSVSASGPELAPVEPAVFRLSSEELTLAAGESAEITLTADTRVGNVEGVISGQVIARSDEDTIHLPFVVEREVETYELVVEYLGRDGKPVAVGAARGLIVGYDVAVGPFLVIEPDAEGRASVRLPRGTYAISNNVFETTYDETGRSYLLLDPELELTSNQTLVVDARVAKPVTIKAPFADAVTASLDVTFSTPVLSSGVGVSGDSELYTAGLGDSVPPETSTAIGAQWISPEDSTEKPYLITASYFVPGELVTGFSREPKTSEFGRASTSIALQSRTAETSFFAYSIPANYTGGVSYLGYPITPPFERDHYYRADPGDAFTRGIDQL